MVADSSYLVERLLELRGELGEEDVITPDLAVPEVVNAILTQQRIFRALADGRPYVDALFGAIEASSLRLVSMTSSLAHEAYDMALRHRVAVNDCVYVALALRYRAELKTLDRRQRKVMNDELAQREARESGPREDGRL